MTVAVLTSQQPAEALSLSAEWAATGDDVIVVLLDGAAAVLRPGHLVARELERAVAAGVRVWAHDVAVHERGLEPAAHVETVDLDRVAALVGDDATRVQWW